jgi:uncharacterized protein (TIGR00255 family)
MTAFARVQVDQSWGSCVWELRSVNHRYLENAFKLPEKFRVLEPKLREALRAKLARGKIEASLYFKANESEQPLLLNRDRVSALLTVADEVKTIAGASNGLSVQQIMNWSGVLESAELDIESIGQAVLRAFDNAIKQLIEARASEGQRLEAMINERLGQVDQLAKQVRERMPVILAEHQKRIETKLAELQVEVDRERLVQEIVLIAQKVDVAEELDRLCAHTDEVRATLQKTEPCGRRLDFLMQELNREANTLGSKSMAIDTSNNAVDLKVLIEQMREQVQNIE